MLHSFIQGCKQIGKALSVPPSAVLCGLISLTSFFVSHSEIKVESTAWSELVIVWLTVGMCTGCGKSSIFKYLLRILGVDSQELNVLDKEPSWYLDEATFEKIGSFDK